MIARTLVTRTCVLLFAVGCADVAWAASFGPPLQLLPQAGHSHAFSDFGAVVLMDGETLMVGEPRERDPAVSGSAVSGSVTVFALNQDGEWQLTQRLTGGATATHNAGFGNAIAVHGSTALVGAQTNDGAVPGSQEGRVHVFEHDGLQWHETQIINSPTGEHLSRFGAAIAMAGDVALIGAPTEDRHGVDSGNAYVYRNINGTWQLDAELIPAGTPQAGDSYGHSIALSGSTALVGAPWTIHSGNGEVYVFDFDELRRGDELTGQWRAQATLVSPNVLVDDRFGVDLAAIGDTAVVAEARSGEAHVFRRIGGVWGGDTSLSVAGAVSAVAVQPNVVLAGQRLQAQARLFSRVVGVWAEQDIVLGAVGSRFGASVTMDGPWAAIGAPQDETNGPKAGAVYVFRVHLGPVDMLQGARSNLLEMGLFAGLENALLVKLDGAVNALEQDQTGLAIHLLNALQNQVNAQRGKKLSTAQADALTEQIQAVLAVMTAV